MKNLVDERVQTAARKAATDNNLELVRAEVAGSGKKVTVRIYIDREGGVRHEDCTAMSRDLEKIFDAEDFIPAAYLLEVSSPGLERELYSLQDFVKFTGSLVKVKLNDPVNGQKNFRGRIASVEGEEITFDDKIKGTTHFPYNAVAKANLEIDLEEELKRG